MMRPGIKEFDAFIRDHFTKELRQAYEEHQVFCEADAQALAWALVRDFLQKFPETNLRVLNKPYFKDVKIHPDLAVFKRDKPWVLLELKEGKKLTMATASRERAR